MPTHLPMNLDLQTFTCGTAVLLTAVSIRKGIISIQLYTACII